MSILGAAAGAISECTTDDLAQRLEAGDVVVVDVREPNETASGVIPGALRIPLGQLPQRIAEVPDGHTVVAVCARGIRSRNAVQLLKAAGVKEAHSLAGGMQAWLGAGHPIQR